MLSSTIGMEPRDEGWIIIKKVLLLLYLGVIRSYEIFYRESWGLVVKGGTLMLNMEFILFGSLACLRLERMETLVEDA